jgi:predicted RNase H-like HicB family nuclease
MPSRTFTVVVERDPDTNWLVGEVVELPGCYTEAPDMQSLESSIQEAIAVYLETKPDADPGPDFVATWRIEVPA